MNGLPKYKMRLVDYAAVAVGGLIGAQVVSRLAKRFRR